MRTNAAKAFSGTSQWRHRLRQFHRVLSATSACLVRVKYPRFEEEVTVIRRKRGGLSLSSCNHGIRPRFVVITRICRSHAQFSCVAKSLGKTVVRERALLLSVICCVPIEVPFVSSKFHLLWELCFLGIAALHLLVAKHLVLRWPCALEV